MLEKWVDAWMVGQKKQDMFEKLSNPRAKRAKRASRGGFYLNLPLPPRGPRFGRPDFVQFSGKWL